MLLFVPAKLEKPRYPAASKSFTGPIISLKRKICRQFSFEKRKYRQMIKRPNCYGPNLIQTGPKWRFESPDRTRPGSQAGTAEGRSRRERPAPARQNHRQQAAETWCLPMGAAVRARVHPCGPVCSGGFCACQVEGTVVGGTAGAETPALAERQSGRWRAAARWEAGSPITPGARPWLYRRIRGAYQCLASAR